MKTPKILTNKLPHLPRRMPPAGERERLSQWFHDWELEQQMRKAIPVEPLRTLPPDQRNKKPTELTKLIAPFDPVIKVGQIRILSGGLFAEIARPMHVAVLSEWPPKTKEKYSKEKLFLVAPFNELWEPATTTEWLTGRKERPLQVLCLWNARTYKAGVLEKSWIVADNLTPQEQADAWEVFKHSLTGVPLCDRVRVQVGAPIIHPRDPRLEYQKEEARLFTIVYDED